MATQYFKGTTALANQQATATPTRPTAPLPPAAIAALSRLSAALPSSADVSRAVIRHGNARARIAELTAVDVRNWSGAQFLALTDAEATVKASEALLAAAGMLHLIEVSP